MRITLSTSVIDACKKYLAWDDSKDPSNIGALNLVSWIGEQIAAAYSSTMRKRVKWRAVPCPRCGAKRGAKCKAINGSPRRVTNVHRARLGRARSGAKP